MKACSTWTYHRFVFLFSSTFFNKKSVDVILLTDWSIDGWSNKLHIDNDGLHKSARARERLSTACLLLRTKKKYNESIWSTNVFISYLKNINIVSLMRRREREKKVCLTRRFLQDITKCYIQGSINIGICRWPSHRRLFSIQIIIRIYRLISIRSRNIFLSLSSLPLEDLIKSNRKNEPSTILSSIIDWFLFFSFSSIIISAVNTCQLFIWLQRYGENDRYWFDLN